MKKFLLKHKIISTMLKTLIAIGTPVAALETFFQAKYLPDGGLIIAVSLLFVIDFATGVNKAKSLGVARTSWRFERIIYKFQRYAMVMIVGYIMRVVFAMNGGSDFIAEGFYKGMLTLMIYVKLLSIFENIYLADTKDKFSRIVIKKLIAIMTLQMKENPIFKLLDEKGKDHKTLGDDFPEQKAQNPE